MLRRKSGRIQVCVERAVPNDEINIPGRIQAWRCARHPYASIAPVGYEIQNRGLLESVGAIGHDPGSVCALIAVRAPGGVNRSVEFQKAGPLVIYGWIKKHVSTRTARARTRIAGSNDRRPAKKFRAASQIQRMYPMDVSSGAVLGNSHDVNGSALAVNHRGGRDADFR